MALDKRELADIRKRSVSTIPRFRRNFISSARVDAWFATTPITRGRTRLTPGGAAIRRSASQGLLLSRIALRARLYSRASGRTGLWLCAQPMSRLAALGIEIRCSLRTQRSSVSITRSPAVGGPPAILPGSSLGVRTAEPPFRPHHTNSKGNPTLWHAAYGVSIFSGAGSPVTGPRVELPAIRTWRGSSPRCSSCAPWRRHRTAFRGRHSRVSSP